jgi:SAM-dependent methyltransferase
MNDTVQSHYDTFLAGNYSWISGSRDEQVRKNRDFFSSHWVFPGRALAAIDLGAGSGFQSVPLAQGGYLVTAVDNCGLLLEEICRYAGELPVETVRSDIRHYSSWEGRHPALIVCMGDTLTHLPALADAENLIRQCFRELIPGGRLVLSLRDYSREPDGATVVVPVRRDRNRIFLCRLEYQADIVIVTDILYSRVQDRWERKTGQYMKIRIAPGILRRVLTSAGFVIEYSAADAGVMEIIARKMQQASTGT